MKGDQIEINESNITAAATILDRIRPEMGQKTKPYILTIAGESGTGKTTTAHAFVHLLEQENRKALVLTLDDYFIYPPHFNDIQRKKDPSWLGPHKEIHFALLDENLRDAMNGKASIVKPQVNYYNNTIENIILDISQVDMIVVEGTYVSLLKNVHRKVFVLGGPEETLTNRIRRNRGNEVRDEFTENILQTEHKIIAGHRFLADFIIDLDFNVIINE